MAHVFITGVSSGIGNALMKRCLSQGHSVTGVVRKEIQKRGLLKQHPKNLHIEVCDLGKKIQVNSLAKKMKSFDYFVLNAGCAVTAMYEDSTDEKNECVIQANLLSNMQLVRAFLPYALKNNAKIVYVSSLLARFPLPMCTSYNVSKAALSHFHTSLSLEYPHLRQLCCEIGAVETEFHKKAGYKKTKTFRSHEVVAHRLYNAMLTKEGTRTLFFNWWLMRKISMMCEDVLVWVIKHVKK